MKCPCCNSEIDDKAIAAYLASKGGSKSRRTLTPEQSAAMNEARKRKKRFDAALETMFPVIT